MKCKNCKSRFGINFEHGLTVEQYGNCMICESDVCTLCAFASEVAAPADIDPGEYITSELILCRGCVNKIQRKQKVA